MGQDSPRTEIMSLALCRKATLAPGMVSSGRGSRIHHQFRPLAEIEVAVFRPMTVILAAVSNLVESGLPLHVRRLVVMLPKPVFHAWSSNLGHRWLTNRVVVGLNGKVQTTGIACATCFEQVSTLSEQDPDASPSDSFNPRGPAERKDIDG